MTFVRRSFVSRLTRTLAGVGGMELHIPSIGAGLPQRHGSAFLAFVGRSPERRHGTAFHLVSSLHTDSYHVKQRTERLF